MIYELTPEDKARGLTIEDKEKVSAFYEGVAIGKVRKAGGSAADIQRVREEFAAARHLLKVDSHSQEKPRLRLL